MISTDGDGLNELVVAHSDRVVRAYRWTSVEELQPSSSVSTTQPSATKATVSSKLVLIDKWIMSGQVNNFQY